MKKLLIFCIASTLETAALFAGTVTNTNNTGAGSLRQAILDAVPGETITFAVTGTITLSSGQGGGQLLIDKSLTISGPGANLLTVTRPTITIGGPFRIFHITASPGTVNISGLTITNGRVTGNDGGGGIRIEQTNCTVNLSNCTISGNSTGDNAEDGGAIFNRGTLTITNCTVSDNTIGSEESNGAKGGGIYNEGSLTVINSTITNNAALGGLSNSYGGGIHNKANLTLIGSTISGNSAVSQAQTAWGGGIDNEAFNNYDATLTIENSTISDNSAIAGENRKGYGGGISNRDSFEGGHSATVSISHSTITDNSAIGFGGGEGGGIQSQESDGSYPDEPFGITTIRSSIIAGNSATTSGPDCLGNIISDDYNLIQNTGGCTFTGVTTHNITGLAPNLGPLQNNGGRTFTHALLSNSPAIDKGICADATDDQRGASRPVDNPSIINANDGCDMGAFEAGGAPPGLAQLNSVVSRKRHGSMHFNITLPKNGSGVECRTGGANGNHMMVFIFANPLTSVQGAGVTSGVGAVSSSGIGNDPHEYFVNLTGVANAQVVTVVLSDVTDSVGDYGTGFQGIMGALLGDTSGNRSVNASDVSQTKSKSGQAIDSSNFRTDVTVSNSINSSDVSLVKSKSGTALP